MAHATQEITKADNGLLYVVTWEWRNGFNLTACRKATEAEDKYYRANSRDGLPVTLKG